jgi:hypothetical protein
MAIHENSICRPGVDLGRKLTLNQGQDYDCDFTETKTNVRIYITMTAKEIGKFILEVS